MRRSTWIAFAAFCLLSSAEWLIPPSASEALPALERDCLLYGVVGFVALLFAVLKRRAARRDEMRWGWLAIGGVGFFGVPALFFEWTAGHLSGMTAVVGFAAVPAIVAMVMSFVDARDGPRRLLAPALAGLGGALLLLPFVLPTAVRGQLMLAGLLAVVALVAALSVWLNKMLHGAPLAEAVVIFSLANAAFMLVCSLGSGAFVWRLSALGSLGSMHLLFEAAELVLMTWLLRDMPPERFSARYLVIPLLTVVEGYVVFRPYPTARMGFGMALLTVGAATVLFWRDRERQESLSLR